MENTKLVQGMFLETEIVDFGVNAEGIAKVDGYVIFVPFAIKGEKVKIRIDYVKKSFAYATLIEVLIPAACRRKPICNRFTRCGGCQLLHVEYNTQLEIKRQSLVNTLRKNAGCETLVDEVFPSFSEYGYRNKLSLPFGVTEGQPSLGFYKEGSHKVVSIGKCFLNGEWAEKLIAIALNFARENKLSVYDEKSEKGLLRHLVARYLDSHLSVTVVINQPNLPFANKLMAALDEAFDNYSLYISVNRKVSNVVMGDSVIKLKGDVQYATLEGVRFPVNPMSFVQVNLPVASEIVSRIVKEIQPSDKTVVIDAYAGIGVLGSILAKKGARILNIEIVSEAIEDGKKLYKDNGLTAEFVCGDAAVELPKIIAKLPEDKEVFIVLDPPRKGVHADVIAAINSFASTRNVKLIYVSCNPATLSRDLSLLDFTPTKITPFDMFSNTNHIETLVSLCRK